MNNSQNPQDTSVNPAVFSTLGAWQNLQIILGATLLCCLTYFFQCERTARTE